MYKKTVLLVEFVSLLILVECALAQDVYHDGNYSNGEYITFQCKDLTDVVFIEGDVTDLNLNLKECKLKMNVTKVKINTSLLSTELEIDRAKLTSFGFSFVEDKEIFSIGSLRILIKATKASILISENNLTISVDKKMILESTWPESAFAFSPFRISDMHIVYGTIQWIFLDFDFDELNSFYLKTSTGNESSIYLPSKCPYLYLDKGGTFIADKTLFTIEPKKHLTIEEFNFKTKEKVIFEAVEGGGCITRLNETGLPFKFIERMEGKFFSRGHDLKIVEGKIEIDGTTLEGKDIYFWTDVDKWKKFNENLELKKKASGVCFDEYTKTLVLSDNANLKITVNGQEVEFKNGKPLKVIPNFPKIYELQETAEKTIFEYQVPKPEEVYSQKDATCEEFGGEWVKEDECPITAVIGFKFNEYTRTKILNYKKGMVCCIKGVPKQLAKVKKVRVGKTEIDIVVSSDVVGREIFTAPKGTVVIDIAPQFLERDLKEAKEKVFVEKVHHLIPSRIGITELDHLRPSYAGAYYRGWRSIEIARAGLKSSTLVHEILHHFYHINERSSLVKEVMKRYIEDKNLSKDEEETRQRLLEILKYWIDWVDGKPTEWIEILFGKTDSHKLTEEKYFEPITCNEGHSVIGQWLYEEFLDLREDVKFPPYVLELYEGILRPEIIEKGRS